ncbi:MAG: TetR/AcrR family transcriptional regulator [Proteobacteria bacterium]|nr:TetR/AcrR family transcriptional regulator [Pseudomonadota bacterium]
MLSSPPPTSAEHSRRLRREAQRGEILEAAAAAIAEHGFHGMSMRGLARATGKGLASFYNYFASKEDLLFSLQTEAFETMTNSVKASLEEVEEPVERLYIFMLNYLCYAAEHKSVIRVLVHEASALPAGRRKTVRLLKEGYFNICRDIVADILTAGCHTPGAEGATSLDPAEVERVTYSVFGMLNWSYGWYDPKQHGTPQDVARTIHALAVCGLVARCPHRMAQGNLERYLGAIAPPPLVGKPARKVTALGSRLPQAGEKSTTGAAVPARNMEKNTV